MAGSLNAFAIKSTAPIRNSSVLTEQDHNARPIKRVRLSDDAVASISTQCAQQETSLEVDHMILDFLAHQTIQACLTSRKSQSFNESAPSLSSSLAMFNTFLSLFHIRHPLYKADPDLRLRILLVKLATLFTQRLTLNPTTPSKSALLQLRSANQERARTWIGSSGFLPSSYLNVVAYDHDLPTDAQSLDRNRAYVLYELGVPAEDEDYEDAFYGTSSCVSLLDILHDFVELSAVRNSMSGSNLTEQWMQLACEFMLQACLEQYLIFGAEGSDPIDEAFSYGYVEPPESDRTGINREHSMETVGMFEDEEYEVEVDGWTDMRRSYIDKFHVLNEHAAASDTSAENGGIVPHLERLATEHPIAEFESRLLQFLEAISKSIPDPVLVQLERGKLAGLTQNETLLFLSDCGVGVANFFEGRAGFKSAPG